MTSLPFMDQINTSFRHLYATRYTQVSSFVLLVFDYFVTLPDEVQFFWHGRWTYPRALFFLNRYQTIIFQLFNTYASFAPRNTADLFVSSTIHFLHEHRTDALPMYIRQAWGHHIIEATGATHHPRCRVSILIHPKGTAIIFCVHLILAFRIYGLYGRNQWIMYFLAALLLGTLAGEIYTASALAPNFSRIPLPFMANQFVCLPIETVDTSLFLSVSCLLSPSPVPRILHPLPLELTLRRTSVPVVVYDVVALALVLIRSVSHMKAVRTVGFKGSSLIRIILRDSVLHFVIILAMYITVAVTWIKFPVAQRFLLTGYAVSTISMTATRMLINLKREAARGILTLGSQHHLPSGSSTDSYRMQPLRHIHVPVTTETVIEIK
ncbi:hypothetical protein ONZ45_g16641 [Pleurotus djamor]|nr:hypothetical protein ONZ45_g16641 [Pleurotus djamor]